jgi:hypothetical protein
MPTFKFSVSGNPARFTYVPDTDWTYTHVDTVRFETPSGPFSLDLIRKDVPKSVANPPFPGLQSEAGKDADGNTVFYAETKITDGLTPQQRKDAIDAHAIAGEGFIARYRYKITVSMPGNTIAVDDQKNGEYRC